MLLLWFGRHMGNSEDVDAKKGIEMGAFRGRARFDSFFVFF